MNKKLFGIGIALLVSSVLLHYAPSYTGSITLIVFVHAALPWILTGLGIALACVGMSTENK